MRRMLALVCVAVACLAACEPTDSTESITAPSTPGDASPNTCGSGQMALRAAAPAPYPEGVAHQIVSRVSVSSKLLTSCVLPATVQVQLMHAGRRVGDASVPSPIDNGASVVTTLPAAGTASFKVVWSAQSDPRCRRGSAVTALFVRLGDGDPGASVALPSPSSECLLNTVYATSFQAGP